MCIARSTNPYSHNVYSPTSMIPFWPPRHCLLFYKSLLYRTLEKFTSPQTETLQRSTKKYWIRINGYGEYIQSRRIIDSLLMFWRTIYTRKLSSSTHTPPTLLAEETWLAVDLTTIKTPVSVAWQTNENGKELPRGITERKSIYLLSSISFPLLLVQACLPRQEGFMG